MSPHTLLHLGLGSFHRAHQAACMQALLDRGDQRWRLVSGNIRAGMDEVIAALQRQRCYTLETIATGGVAVYQTIGAIDEVIAFEPGVPDLVRIGADAATRIISFTVTEAGYYLDPDDRLDAAHSDVAHDLTAFAAGQVGRTLYGVIAAILAERRRRSGESLTLLCCDNLRHNGVRFRRGLLQFLALTGDADLLAWAEARTSSPNAMVDRITPRPTEAMAERVRRAVGWPDAAPVMAERHLQWVIEDDFIAGRPPWEDVGVQMVDSVAPYEEAKIRILNGSHSGIAWAAALRGHQSIDAAMRDPLIRKIAFDYVSDDVLPCLQPSPVDLPAYRDQVFERFANAALGDSVERVIADGWSKLPGFIVPTLRERLANKLPIAGSVVLPALFLAVLQRWHDGSLPVAYEDQVMDVSAARAICNADDPVVAFCSDAALWGDLAGSSALITAMQGARTYLVRVGLISC